MSFATSIMSATSSLVVTSGKSEDKSPLEKVARRSFSPRKGIEILFAMPTPKRKAPSNAPTITIPIMMESTVHTTES